MGEQACLQMDGSFADCALPCGIAPDSGDGKRPVARLHGGRDICLWRRHSDGHAAGAAKGSKEISKTDYGAELLWILLFIL